MNNRDLIIRLGKKYLIIWIGIIVIRGSYLGLLLPYLMRIIKPEIYNSVFNNDYLFDSFEFLLNIILALIILIDFKKIKLNNSLITILLTILTPITGIIFLLLNVASIKENRNE